MTTNKNKKEQFAAVMRGMPPPPPVAPMKLALLKRTIMRAWWDLERACGGYATFHGAYRAAQEEEQRHRSMGRGIGSYRISVDDAARYFVVKRFAELPAAPKTYREICGIQISALYAWATREQASEDRRVPNFSEDFYKIDYARDIAR